MTPQPTSASRRLALVAACYGVLLAGLLLAGTMASGVPGWWVPALAIMGASLLAGTAIVWVSRGVTAVERRSWLLIGLGVLSWALGDVTWATYHLAGWAIPYPGPADFFYLAAYPLWLAGLVSFPHARTSRFGRFRLLLDGAAGTIALAILMWHLYLSDLVSFEGANLLERLVNPAYPFGDVLLLAGLVILSVRQSPFRLYRPLLILGAGVVCNAIADVLYWVNFDTYRRGVWFDGFWVLGYGLFAFAAFAAARSVRPHELPDRRRPVPNLLLLYTLVGGLIVVASYRLLTGSLAIGIKVLVLGAGLVMLIVIVRQAVAFREYLEVVETERRDLVATIAHELRTPLTAMSGFSEVLASDWQAFPDHERTELLTSVADQTRYLSRIVADLVEVSRDNLEKTSLKIGTHSVAALVGQATELANLGSNTHLVVDVPADLDVVGDRDRLIQIMVNLLSNAARYGKGEALLRARALNGVRLEVHDNGPGVPIKYRELIWDRFERGAHRLDAATPGSGIGLAIVEGLIHAHSGTVTYEDSPLLGGACFVVVLPASPVAVLGSRRPLPEPVAVA